MIPVSQHWYDDRDADARHDARQSANAVRLSLEVAGIVAEVSDDPPWKDGMDTYVFGPSGCFHVEVPDPDRKRALDVLGDRG